MRERGGSLSARDQVAAGAEGLSPRLPLTIAITSTLDAGQANGHFSCIPRRLLPDTSHSFRQDHGPALRRESPSAGGALRRGRQRHCRAPQQLHGKELSYNNLVDLRPRWDLVQEFDEPARPSSSTPIPAERATADTRRGLPQSLECDPVSAFGGVIGVNRVGGRGGRAEMAKLFVEAIAAPGLLRRGARQLAGQEESAPRGGGRRAETLVIKIDLRRIPRCRMRTPHPWTGSQA